MWPGILKKKNGVAGERGSGWFENIPDFQISVFKREMTFSVGVDRPYILSYDKKTQCIQPAKYRCFYKKLLC